MKDKADLFNLISLTVSTIAIIISLIAIIFDI